MSHDALSLFDAHDADMSAQDDERARRLRVR